MELKSQCYTQGYTRKAQCIVHNGFVVHEIGTWIKNCGPANSLHHNLPTKMQHPCPRFNSPKKQKLTLGNTFISFLKITE